MPIDPLAGQPFGREVAMPMMQRPEQIAQEIQQIIAHGTVDDLFSPRSQLLQQVTGHDYLGWMSADEKDTCHNGLPMPTCPNFDGETCDYCRGKTRFRQCGTCHGEMIPVHLRPRRDDQGNYLTPPTPPAPPAPAQDPPASFPTAAATATTAAPQI